MGRIGSADFSEAKIGKLVGGEYGSIDLTGAVVKKIEGKIKANEVIYDNDTTVEGKKGDEIKDLPCFSEAKHRIKAKK